VITGDPALTTDRAAIDLSEPSGLLDDEPLGDVLQDRFDFPRRESGVEEREPFTRREAGLASLTKTSLTRLLNCA
jgi:hypothetical protein